MFCGEEKERGQKDMVPAYGMQALSGKAQAGIWVLWL